MQNRDEKVCPESQNVLIQGTGASEWKRPWGARLMPIPKRGSRASTAEGKGSTQVQAASDQTGIFFITQIYFITRSRGTNKWGGRQRGRNHCYRKTKPKTEQSLRDLRDNIKRTNVRITGVPEKKREKGPEKIVEEIIAKNFLNTGKETLTQVEEAQRIQSKIISGISTVWGVTRVDAKKKHTLPNM